MAYTIIDTCIGCTACTKRCPTDAITGTRNVVHVIDPNLCIDCGACGVVCPPEAILDTVGDVCKTFARKEWPKAIVVEDNCIGSGCELCIQICPFDALSLGEPERTTGDFYGIAVLNEKRCTGCRLCEDACGWGRDLYRPTARDAQEARLARGRSARAEKGERARSNGMTVTATYSNANRVLKDTSFPWRPPRRARAASTAR